MRPNHICRHVSAAALSRCCRRAGGAIAACLALGAAPVAIAAPMDAVALPAQSERGFLVENEKAMDKMMAGMTVKPTGDVDRDFVAMMVPHHQGAIDMAVAVLRYGRNPQIRRLAQE